MPTTPLHKLASFGLSNYRSFGEEGFWLQCDKKINVIIGKNNAGKSNIINGVHYLAKIPDNKFKLGKPSDTDLHQDTQKNPIIQARLETRELVNIAAKLYWPSRGQDLQNSTGNTILVQWDSETGNVVSEAEIERLHNVYETLYSALKGEPVRYSSEKYREIIPKLLQQEAARSLRETLGEHVLLIPVARSVGADAPLSDTTKFTGKDLIQKLHAKIDPEPDRNYAQNRKVYEQVRDFVRRLLKKPDLDLRISSKNHVLTLTIPPLRDPLPLSSFGTGIEHVVLLASAIAMFEGKTILIEEPETNLHPELQRELLRFIESTDFTYYISTHSNVFLDSLSNSSAIYHVRKEETTSKVIQANTTEQTRYILDDMNYRASDLLQANGVIWVEGPSDRIYLNKWLSFVDPSLVEGIHYAITFYGGKVLAHFSGSDDPIGSFIQILRINRHTFFLLDRDGDEENATLNKSKQRIIDELGENSCWVTQGREIENYIPVTVIRDCLTGTESLAFGENDKLGKKLVEANVMTKYDKVKYAHKFCDKMDETSLDILDLRTQVAALAQKIRQWNK